MKKFLLVIGLAVLLFLLLILVDPIGAFWMSMIVLMIYSALGLGHAFDRWKHPRVKDKLPRWFFPGLIVSFLLPVLIWQLMRFYQSQHWRY